MRKFNWSNFNEDFLRKVILDQTIDPKEKARIEARTDKDSLAGEMLRLYQSPDNEFVMKYRNEIEELLFPQYPSKVKQIIKALGISGSNFNIRQANLSAKRFTKSMANAYVEFLYFVSGNAFELNEFSKFSQTIPIDMDRTPAENVDLYDFQKSAVKKLEDHFIKKNNKKGMLVMPTGSGKTRTATYFLIKDMIAAGYQILWICHRHMLIEQAADCFYRFAGLAKINNPAIRDYRISCISGEHLSCSMVGKGDEIIVASIQSICRNKAHLSRILGRKVMIVVDEAHHTFAPSYRDVIKHVTGRKTNVKLLGLTATPVRANEADSQRLLNLFDNNIVYEIAPSELITKGFLADPHFKRVDTNESYEESLDNQEKSYIRYRKDLPESVVKRIAESKERNDIILSEYLDNRKKYGKTLIFAMNQIHCRLLAEALNAAKVPCGVVYSGQEDNARIIREFKENKFDVLVNVNIMTEGTDVPDIQTVFLTRPTQSEGFLMQMIGRGMRGPKAQGGTKTVNIVDFHDKWEVFNRWLNPERLISDENKDIEPPRPPEPGHTYIGIEWRDIQEMYRLMTTKAKSVGSFLSVPYGWYSVYDKEGIDTKIIVFEDQLEGYEELLSHKEEWDDNDINSDDAERVLSRYFNYFCNRPSYRDIEVMLINMRDNAENVRGNFHIFAERDTIDPLCVVEAAEKEGKDIFEYAGQVFESNELAGDLYDTKENYILACCNAKIYKNNPIKVGEKVEELELSLVDIDTTPVYDLQALMQEVIDEMSDYMPETIEEVIIQWTNRPMKSYFGKHYSEGHRILINSVLNSKDVPKEAVKYVIYHEILHEDIPHHGPEFRQKEHQYPNWADHDHTLDTLFNKYGIYLN
jgi:superfamily II DNA or RNA helicase